MELRASEFNSFNSYCRDPAKGIMTPTKPLNVAINPLLKEIPVIIGLEKDKWPPIFSFSLDLLIDFVQHHTLAGFCLLDFSIVSNWILASGSQSQSRWR